jgi:hypothetical protein
MKFSPNFHLAYSTNIHPAERWNETFDALRRYTNSVRKTVAGSKTIRNWIEVKCFGG